MMAPGYSRLKFALLARLPWIGSASFLLIFLASTPLALACKPASLPPCEEKELIPLHAPSFEALSGKLTELQSKLTEALAKRPPPKGAGDCFNSNFSVFYLRQIKEAAAKHQGKICTSAIPFLKRSTEQLVNADSIEWKAVKGRQTHARLSTLAQETRAALEEFLHQH